MADFVQTMKDWHRMCKAYTTDDDSCCEGCPVVDFHEYGCGAIFETEDVTDWQRYAETITAWAAEHPEPVYPTVYEWLVSIGLLGSDMWSVSDLNKPIPADIAQKLGIEPKEG